MSLKEATGVNGHMSFDRYGDKVIIGVFFDGCKSVYCFEYDAPEAIIMVRRMKDVEEYFGRVSKGICDCDADLAIYGTLCHLRGQNGSR